MNLAFDYSTIDKTVIRNHTVLLTYILIKYLHLQEFPIPFNIYGIVFDGMNTIFSAKILKLDKPISGNFDIVEDPNIDQNRTIPVKYTLKKRSEGTYTLLFLNYIYIQHISTYIWYFLKEDHEQTLTKS